MGGTQSRNCKTTLQNPDMLNVVTLSDSAVQRLPLVVDSSLQEKEQRKQNVDDFWRVRLSCMEQTYEDTKKMTENEFDRLESSIKSMAIGKGQWTCPRLVEDTATCLLVYGKEPLKCEHLVRQFELCMDTLTAESTKRKHMDDIRRARKKICLSSA